MSDPPRAARDLELGRDAVAAAAFDVALRHLDRALAADRSAASAVADDLHLEPLRSFLLEGGDDALRGLTHRELFEGICLVWRASRRRKEGRLREALEDSRRATTLVPMCTSAYVGWECAAWGLQDHDELRRSTVARLERPDGDAEDVETLLFWFYRVAPAGTAGGADLVLDRALRLHPDRSEAHFAAAFWAAQRGDVAGAIEALARVVEQAGAIATREWLIEELDAHDEFDALRSAEAFQSFVRELESGGSD
jgi:hypothetical protein